MQLVDFLVNKLYLCAMSNKQQLDELINKYGFHKVGYVTKEQFVYEGRGRRPKDPNKKQLKFTPLNEAAETLCRQRGIYVTIDDTSEQDFYIGSAMNGWIERFQRVKSALHNKTAGGTNVKTAQRFEGTDRILVYYLQPAEGVMPQTGELYDTTQSVENFLINKYRPHYNVATKR